MDGFLNLTRAHHKPSGTKAPHKPVLLLAVLELFEEGFITENCIRITPELVASFQKLWAKLVLEPHWQPRMFLPFYHLVRKKKPFWFLVYSGEMSVGLAESSYSPNSLRELSAVVDHAFLSPSMFAKFMNPAEREAFRQSLLHTYFPQSNYNPIEVKRERVNYLQQLEKQFLSGQAAEDAPEEIEEVRGALFKTQVPKIYNYRCAMSGLHITATSNIAMVDACHIQPWSVEHNDSVQNGICLTPTLHRAFDRGLISISEDYRVITSPHFLEHSQTKFSISQLRNLSVLLPDDARYRPSTDLLKWHREKIFIR